MAVVFLYPLTKVQEDFRLNEQASAFGNDHDHEHEHEHDTTKSSPDVWFTKQRIGNACGTIGILHALANIPEPLKVVTIPSTSWLGKFFDDCPAALSPIAKAERLEQDEEIESKHDEATSDSRNQTSRGALEDKVETHFVALTNVGGELFELDGRKAGPISHGRTSQESFLKDSANVVQKFMDRDPGEMRFTILALAPVSI